MSVREGWKEGSCKWQEEERKIVGRSVIYPRVQPPVIPGEGIKALFFMLSPLFPISEDMCSLTVTLFGLFFSTKGVRRWAVAHLITPCVSSGYLLTPWHWCLQASGLQTFLVYSVLVNISDTYKLCTSSTFMGMGVKYVLHLSKSHSQKPHHRTTAPPNKKKCICSSKPHGTNCYVYRQPNWMHIWPY